MRRSSHSSQSRSSPRRLAAGALLAAASLTLSVTGCRSRTEFSAPIPLDETFQVELAGGPERERYEEAARYSAETGGAAVLVLRGRTILFEDYRHGYTAESPLHIFSGTKSFSGILAACAVADGALDLDELASETLTELREDPQAARVTVRQLLNFTSGWRRNFLRVTWDALHVEQRVADKYADTLALGTETEPGSVYRYGPEHLTVFGALLKRKVGDPLTYLERRVFGPIGLRTAGWIRDPAGNPMLPFGAWTSAREWGKFGALLLAEGRWNEQVVVPAELLTACREGSEAMPAYGLTFWLNQPVPERLKDGLIPGLKHKAGRGPLIWAEGPRDLYAAAGHQGNRCYVIPSRGLVVVRLGFAERGFDDAEFLRRALD